MIFFRTKGHFYCVLLLASVLLRLALLALPSTATRSLWFVGLISGGCGLFVSMFVGGNIVSGGQKRGALFLLFLFEAPSFTAVHFHSTGDKFEDFVQEDDRHRELHDGHPLGEVERGDLEDGGHDVHVEDQEMQGHGQRDGGA